jgi:hypothetical protein
VLPSTKKQNAWLTQELLARELHLLNMPHSMQDWSGAVLECPCLHMLHDYPACQSYTVAQQVLKMCDCDQPGCFLTG